ncbi:MAG: DUF559 domain-containing protein [Hamadaea sp.]|uniref:DUF559 domain-containing protein n=1 Tax=Hamadaea sp. TaxID=2024425 RepID=UPI00185D9340|nr:DUF559 domain-containing protein [Hamadaea sp.]NUR70556.1 DUF559 domain-containing protein [Hamadaea sp.]NUT19315.1 DUF559 domain-containing protein [Hamadaea sp.]
MHDLLHAEVDRHSGLVIVSNLADSVPRWVVDNAVRTGELIRLWPGVYRYAEGPVVDPRRAVIAYAGDQAALSHTSALVVWGLVATEPDGVFHVTVPRERRLRSRAGLVVHTRDSFTLTPPEVVQRSGLPVTALDDSLVAAWPLAAEPQRVGIVLDAIGERLTLPIRIAEAVGRTRTVVDRASLVRLVDRLAGGCRSQLELFGADHVFTGPDLPDFRRQVPVIVAGRTFYLDLYAERERVDIELDGASWHGSAQQRERDVRRDAALATVGILVVRYTYRRLVSDSEGVRRELGRILARRRN